MRTALYHNKSMNCLQIHDRDDKYLLLKDLEEVSMITPLSVRAL